MSRSGYSEDDDFCDDEWRWIMWRGAVESALRGRRGQSFLHDLAEALDAMPEKRLIRNELVAADGERCALGVLGQRRGLPVGDLDPYDHETIAGHFNIAAALARELMFVNDEVSQNQTPEERYERVLAWVRGQIKSEKGRSAPTEE